MITFEKLKELLTYCPDTGQFTWNYSRSGSGKTYKEAGHITNHGYRRIRILAKNYFAQRLAWLYMTGEWPKECLQVDHINNDKLDNRWCNLRLLTPEQNSKNCRAQINNTSGFKGVTKRGKRYEANLYHDGKLEYLGVYTSAKEASDVYEARLDEINK